MKCTWILNPNKRSSENASAMRSGPMPRRFKRRMRASRLCTPIWIFVQPSLRANERLSHETASGRVSITKPTARQAASSLAACCSSSSGRAARWKDEARSHGVPAP